MATSTVFSVGRDCSAIVTHPLVGRLDIQHVTGFHADPEYTSPQVKRLDGVKLTQHLPDGWAGEFEVERGNQAADALCSAIEDGYYVGGVRQYATLTQYIQEADGSTSTFQFDNVTLKFSLGAWSQDQTVKQKIMFNASRRRKV